MMKFKYPKTQKNENVLKAPIQKLCMTIYEYNVRNQHGSLPETVLSMFFLQIKENFLNSVHVFPDNVTSRGFASS